MRDLSRSAGTWPFRLATCPTPSSYSALLARARHSLPGPDGIPYAGWSAAGPLGAETRWLLGDHLAGGALPPWEFNHALQVFAPKGDQPLDDFVVLRSPEDTRPLALKNTDNKAIAGAFAAASRRPLTLGPCSIQNGFVPKRHLMQNLVDLDAASRMYGIPAAAAVVALYTNVAALGSSGDGLVFLFWVCSGVLQGCPFSGLLFVSAIDPLLRKFQHDVDDRGHGTTRACADDIAAALCELATASVYARSFSLARKAAGLCLNFRKCVAVPLAGQFTLASRCGYMEWFERFLPEWGGLTVSHRAKILGMYLGPAVTIDAWEAPMAKWMARTHHIAKQGLAPSVSTLAYKRSHVWGTWPRCLCRRPVCYTRKCVRSTLSFTCRRPPSRCRLPLSSDAWGCWTSGQPLGSALPL